MKTVSVVLPCKDEEKNILPILDAVAASVSGAGAVPEVVFVDDGSSDKTWDAIRQTASSGGKKVRALRFTRNFGKEAAIAAGLEAATGDAVIIMDADFQHPPDLIPKMIRCWAESGADVVEMVKSDRGRESLPYRLFSSVFYRAMNRLSGFRFSGSSDFKLLDRKVIMSWQKLGERNLFFRGLVPWMGFESVKIPFSTGQRMAGKGQWTLTGLMRLALTGLTAFSSLPLRLVTFTGAVFLAFALVLGTRAVIIKLYHNVLDGITLLIVLNLIIGSIIMISLGIIGEYIANIYNEVKQRPRYLISEEIHPD